MRPPTSERPSVADQAVDQATELAHGRGPFPAGRSCRLAGAERGRLGGHPVEQPVQLGLGLGQLDPAAFGGQAAREGDLVVVDVLAQPVLAGTTIGTAPMCRAPRMVPGPPWQTTAAAEAMAAWRASNSR